jgi:hypothetical protein
VGVYHYYTFTLRDGLNGLKRALKDAGIPIRQMRVAPDGATLTVALKENVYTVHLKQTHTRDHPLGRLGPVSVVQVTVPDDWEGVETLLALAFLRGGG